LALERLSRQKMNALGSRIGILLPNGQKVVIGLWKNLEAVLDHLLMFRYPKRSLSSEETY
jgi:hypothetical protein